MRTSLNLFVEAYFRYHRECERDVTTADEQFIGKQLYILYLTNPILQHV
jgi:hypothetical protein